MRELEEAVAKLEADARKLSTGRGRDDLLQDVARFRARLAAVQAALPKSGEGLKAEGNDAALRDGVSALVDGSWSRLGGGGFCRTWI